MLDLIAARILAAPASPIVTVGTGLDLAASLKTPPAKVPAAYVWPVGAVGGTNGLITGHRQRIATSIGVTLVLRRHGDAVGGRKADDLDTLIPWLRDLLIGWAPTGDHEPLSFDRAGLDAMAGGTVWWTEQFATSHYHVGG